MPDDATAESVFSQLAPLHWGAIALAILLLVIGLRLILRKPPTHLMAFSGEAGKVLVSRKALQELIKQACLLDDWVEAARPVVRVRGDKVSALVELRLASPEHLKDVCERVQQRITALLQKSLSFEQIGDIQIVVKSFATQPEPRKPEETAILLDRTKPLPRPVAPADAPRVASQPPAASTEAIAPVETAEPKPETADASPSERIPPPPADPER